MFMSEEKIAALEARVAELESQLAVFVERAKDDDEALRSFSERINEATGELHREMAEYRAEIEKLILEHVRSVTASAYNAVAAQILEGITPEKIAEGLTKGAVLATRPATRDEIRDGKALPVRQLTTAELRQ